MNPKLIVGFVGAVTALLGVLGLFYPEQVMLAVGFGHTNPANIPGTFGEVRAIYGGLTLVAGVFTLLATANPSANQGRLVLLGLLWIGAFGGRMLGIFVDGNPGIVGWVSATTELLGGAALLYASQASPAMPDASTTASAPPI